MRLVELRSAGVTAATVSRMARAGEVIRLARGLYQLPDAPFDTSHSLAEAAKRLPKGVVCLVSALAFHGLTDQLPKKVWMAIGKKDWAPKPDGMPIRVIRLHRESARPKRRDPCDRGRPGQSVRCRENDRGLLQTQKQGWPVGRHRRSPGGSASA